MVTKRRLNLLSRYLASECTEDERHEVEQWINVSEKNKATFDKLRAIWKLSGEELRGWDSRRAIAAFRLKLKETNYLSRNPDGGKLKLYRIIPYRKNAMVHASNVMAQGIAAFLILAGAFYAAYYIKRTALEIKVPQSRSPAEAFEELSTKPGQQATVRFSDGTKVILNSDSKLKYKNDPAGRREFYLDGEAYFEIVHSNNRPVIVQTAHAVIKDLGTKFDVKSWNDDGQTKVVVADGEVFIQPNHDAQDKVIVSRGKYSIVKEDGTIIPPLNANVKRNIAWLDGKLVFFNEPMRSVTKQLHRKYGLECFAADSSILYRTLTATFDDQLSPQQVLNIIALSLNVTYRTSKDSIFFVPAKPHLEWKHKSNQKED